MQKSPDRDIQLLVNVLLSKETNVIHQLTTIYNLQPEPKHVSQLSGPALAACVAEKGGGRQGGLHRQADQWN